MLSFLGICGTEAHHTEETVDKCGSYVKTQTTKPGVRRCWKFAAITKSHEDLITLGSELFLSVHLKLKRSPWWFYPPTSGDSISLLSVYIFTHLWKATMYLCERKHFLTPSGNDSLILLEIVKVENGVEGNSSGCGTYPKRKTRSSWKDKLLGIKPIAGAAHLIQKCNTK